MASYEKRNAPVVLCVVALHRIARPSLGGVDGGAPQPGMCTRAAPWLRPPAAQRMTRRGSPDPPIRDTSVCHERRSTIYTMDEPAAARHASSPFAAPIMAMGDAAIVRLSGTPWCAALINDPAWTPTRTESRVPKPTSEDSFFAETLGTQRTIRACLTLRPAHEEVGGDWAYRHIRVLMELGDGLNGHPRICHGGFVATMLDEVLGALIVLDIEARRRRGEAAQNMSCFTACEL